MAGILSRLSRPAPLSPYRVDDPFESTAVPGAEQRSGGSSPSFLSSLKQLEAGPDEHPGSPDHLSRAALLESWRSTPSTEGKSRDHWNGEYLYLSTPRRGPRLERGSPIPLEYDQPIAETTPSASSDEFEPDVASPLFQKTVEALRREGWGKAFQRQKEPNDGSSSEAETEIQEADLETEPGLRRLPEASFSTQNEPPLAFGEEPSTARGFDAGLLLDKVDFHTTSASARSFNSRRLASRTQNLNDARNDKACITAASAHTAVQAYKATGLVRKVDISTPPSTNSSSSNQSRLRRKPKFEVPRDAAKVPAKRESLKGIDGRPPTVLKDKTNLPLRIREQPRQPSPDALKQKPHTEDLKLQQSQHSLPDALKAGFIKQSETTGSALGPTTATRESIPSNFKTAATGGSSCIPQPSPLPARYKTPSKRTHKPKAQLPVYRSGRVLSPDHAEAISRTLTVLEREVSQHPPSEGSSGIPQPSPLPARSHTPSKRTHKPIGRLTEYRSGRFLSPDHAEAISRTLAVLEGGISPHPLSDSPPLVRHARHEKEDYAEHVQFDQDELVLHQPTPMRGAMAMRKVVKRFERMAMDTEEEVNRQQELLGLGRA